MTVAYRALVSSDWNQCLAPSGPFDVITHLYPHLKTDLDAIFTQYTGNRITLADAMAQVQTLLPQPISAAQLDAFLTGGFAIYRGVAELIQACGRNKVLFMINTTAIIGYFQRAVALGLMPSPPVLSAHPMVRFEPEAGPPEIILPLLETTDKGKNTQAIAERFNIPASKIIVIGDSGGDGPHFEWGARAGATLVGSMTKISLADYCRLHQIAIDHLFGHTYTPGEVVFSDKEQDYDFMALWDLIEKILESAATP
jgi:hypothetical protein